MTVEVEKAPKEAHIEEIADSDDEKPTSDHEGHDCADPLQHAHGRQLGRGERKARKALAKMGLKPVPGITRLVMKRAKGVMFTITKPDVFKSAVGDMFVCFGEARIEDLNSQMQANAAQQFKAAAPADAGKAAPAAIAAAKAPAAEGDDEEVDETGVDAKDIELVINQAGCSRSAAVKALKANENDVVNAIMELSM